MRLTDERMLRLLDKGETLLDALILLVKAKTIEAGRGPGPVVSSAPVKISLSLPKQKRRLAVRKGRKR